MKIGVFGGHRRSWGIYKLVRCKLEQRIWFPFMKVMRSDRQEGKQAGSRAIIGENALFRHLPLYSVGRINGRSSVLKPM